MPIKAVRLGDDRKTVTIALEKVRTVPNFALQYRIKSADGAKLRGRIARHHSSRALALHKMAAAVRL